jgi:hypothetical protein
MDARGCPHGVKRAEREVSEDPQAQTGQADNARQVGTGELDRSRNAVLDPHEIAGGKEQAERVAQPGPDARKRQEYGHLFSRAGAARPHQPTEGARALGPRTPPRPLRQQIVRDWGGLEQPLHSPERLEDQEVEVGFPGLIDKAAPVDACRLEAKQPIQLGEPQERRAVVRMEEVEAEVAEPPPTAGEVAFGRS